jgi:hypothetical protein
VALLLTGYALMLFSLVIIYAAQVLSSGVTRSSLYNWLKYLPYMIMAVIVVLIWKPQKLSRPQKTLGFIMNKSDKSNNAHEVR